MCVYVCGVCVCMYLSIIRWYEVVVRIAGHWWKCSGSSSRQEPNARVRWREIELYRSERSSKLNLFASGKCVQIIETAGQPQFSKHLEKKSPILTNKNTRKYTYSATKAKVWTRDILENGLACILYIYTVVYYIK